MLLPGALREAAFALKEDSRKDVTSRAVIGRGFQITGTVVCEAEAVLAGVEEAKCVLGKACRFRRKEGAMLKRGTVVAQVSGEALWMFSRIRTFLDILAYMSGIATAADKFSRLGRVAGTRKTHPGARHMEKRALEVGGGLSHRMTLEDGVLIKKEHLAVLGHMLGLERLSGELAAEAVMRAKKKSRLPVIIEVEEARQAEAAAWAGADVVMLDNFKREKLGEAVRRVKKANQKVLVEASGGIGLEDVGFILSAGVDVVSTSRPYSAPPVGFRFEIKKVGRG